MTTAYKPRSTWWADTAHRVRGTDLATRLALAMAPVAAIVRVIDYSVPPMEVAWSDVSTDKDGKAAARSYTNFGRSRIVVNPMPVIEAAEGKLDHARAIDVVTGFAMHEASHSQHTRPVWPVLLTKDGAGKEIPAFRPMRLASYLLNLLEDVRIEDLTAKRWPGAGPYFTAVLDYMWETAAEPTDEPEFAAIAARIRTVYLACRYPDRWEERLPATEAPEIAWWSAWQADYLAGTIDAPEAIRRGLDHLREDTATEMQAMEDQEKAREAAGENLRKMIEQMMAEGIDGTYIVCINEDGEATTLDPETAEKVRQMLREELTEEQTPLRQTGARNPAIHVRRPEETAASRAAFIGQPSSLMEAVRAGFVFRPAAPEHMIKLQKSGHMDDAELYRWAMGDYRVFSERVIETKPETLIGLLVDLSGSMSGQKLRTAQELAQLMVWALHDQDGVETRVWGHTGDTDETDSADLYRLWEPGDPLSRLGIISTLDHTDNYDSHAVAWCVRQMKDAPQPQKVLIVLSDGRPAGTDYGGEPAKRHVRQVTDWAERVGVTVLQIAIDSSLDRAAQARMFKFWTGYTSTADLPRELSRIMTRFA